tara:strand:+ start:4696 stop:5121 length:426 start_codon:yes stop_codon:yes gene_type:complete
MVLKNYNSQGASVTFGTSGLSGKLLSASGVEQSRDAMEITDLGIAANGAKRFIPADIYDTGTIDIEFLFSSASALPALDAVAETITITFPKATTAGASATLAGSGFIQSRSTPELSVGDTMKMSCSVQFDGETAPVYSAGS